MNLTPTFTKHPSPVLLRGEFSWESGDLANPDVFVDYLMTRGYKYVMNYSAYGTVSGDLSPKWRMCLAYSNDLMIWVKEPLNPIFSPNSGEGYIVTNGSIVLRGLIYYHFYQTGTSGSEENAQIRLAISSDLINWTRVNGGNPIIARTPGGPDSVGLFDPQVALAKDGETFEMRYTAYGDTNTSSCVLATSTDGISWTKLGQEVISQLPTFANPGEPCGLKLGLKQFISYDAYVGGARKIGGAVKYNAGSTQYLGFFVQPSFSWDSANVFDSFMHFDEDSKKIFLFFAGGSNVSGNEGMNSSIGVAIADYDPYNIHADEPALYYATEDITFEDAGVETGSISAIYKIGNPILGYDSSLEINNIDSFEDGEFYLVKPKGNLDLSHILTQENA